MCVLLKSYFLWEFQAETFAMRWAHVGARTKFQVEIVTINVISGIVNLLMSVIRISDMNNLNYWY